jgi:hypothetical protein
MCTLDVTTVCPECGTEDKYSIGNPSLPHIRLIICKNCNKSYNAFGNIASMNPTNSTVTESGIILVQRWALNNGLAVPWKLPLS